MNVHATAAATITGQEHWAHKGAARLSLILHAFFSQPAPVVTG